jgi:hypothetical protein
VNFKQLSTEMGLSLKRNKRHMTFNSDLPCAEMAWGPEEVQGLQNKQQSLIQSGDGPGVLLFPAVSLFITPKLKGSAGYWR